MFSTDLRMEEGRVTDNRREISSSDYLGPHSSKHRIIFTESSVIILLTRSEPSVEGGLPGTFRAQVHNFDVLDVPLVTSSPPRIESGMSY